MTTESLPHSTCLTLWLALSFSLWLSLFVSLPVCLSPSPCLSLPHLFSCLLYLSVTPSVFVSLSFSFSMSALPLPLPLLAPLCVHLSLHFLLSTFPSSLSLLWPLLQKVLEGQIGLLWAAWRLHRARCLLWDKHAPNTIQSGSWSL